MFWRRWITHLVLLVSLLTTRVAFADGPSDGLPPITSAANASATVDRGSPRRSFDGFLRAGGRGEFALAAHYLDLRSIPKSRQANEGPQVAEKLYWLLTHVGRFDVAKIPDDPDAAVPKGEPSLEVAALDVRDGPIPIGMTRAKFADGVERWIFARTGVAVAPVLYAGVTRPTWVTSLPAWMRTSLAGNAVWQWLGVLLLVPVALLLARVVAAVAKKLLGALARRTPSPIDDALVVALEAPLRVAVVALVIDVASGYLHLTLAVADFLGHVSFSLMVVAGAWAAIRTVVTVTKGIEGAPGATFEEEMARRRVKTRLAIFQRVTIVLVIVVAFALMLLQFERVRSVGVSLLASAGLAGVVLGFAAQRSLGAIISGIQLSITQPIRIGDQVVVEGEFGTIEAINLTQIIVALWDERRLIVPVTRFLEQPFQNWSRAGEKLLGAVTLECDYTTPVERLRGELRRVVEESKLWDKSVCSLQVTEVQGRSITVRALVSAANPGALWDLRCEVRERLVAFLRELESGEFFPAARMRVLEHPATRMPDRRATRSLTASSE